MKRIAVICERDRAYGRGLCLGIAGAAARERDWSLEFVDDLSVVRSTRLAGFDGVIARISNDGIAADLKAAGLLVAPASPCAPRSYMKDASRQSWRPTDTSTRLFRSRICLD